MDKSYFSHGNYSFSHENNPTELLGTLLRPLVGGELLPRRTGDLFIDGRGHRLPRVGTRRSQLPTTIRENAGDHQGSTIRKENPTTFNHQNILKLRIQKRGNASCGFFHVLALRRFARRE